MIKYSRSLPDPDFFSVTISSHIISFRFLPISGHLQITQEIQNWSIRSRRISCHWGKFFRLCQKERFLEPIEKSPYIVNYWWAGVSNYVYSTILVIKKISFLLYFTSVLLLKMWSQPASIAWTVTTTATFYYCWNYTEHSDFWIRCVIYTLY